MVDGFDSMYCREFLSHVLLHATDTWLKALLHNLKVLEEQTYEEQIEQ